MEMYGNVWKIHGNVFKIYGNVWKCIENLWKSMEMFRNVWQCMKMNVWKCAKTCEEVYGNVLKCIKMSGNEWKSLLFFWAIFSVFCCTENVRKIQGKSMENVWKCMELYGKIYGKLWKSIENLWNRMEMR